MRAHRLLLFVFSGCHGVVVTPALIAVINEIWSQSLQGRILRNKIYFDVVIDILITIVLVVDSILGRTETVLMKMHTILAYADGATVDRRHTFLIVLGPLFGLGTPLPVFAANAQPHRRDDILLDVCGESTETSKTRPVIIRLDTATHCSLSHLNNPIY